MFAMDPDFKSEIVKIVRIVSFKQVDLKICLAHFNKK